MDSLRIVTNGDAIERWRIMYGVHVGAYLHVLVLDVLAAADAVGDVQVDELGRQRHHGR